MEHQISVSLVGETVHAEPNPLSAVEPGDAVTWDLSRVGDRRLLVVFQEVQRLSAPAGEARPCGENGPFEGLVHQPGRISGTIPPGSPVESGGRRFIYKFMENDRQVEWENPLEGRHNFGGIDMPQPPPRG